MKNKIILRAYRATNNLNIVVTKLITFKHILVQKISESFTIKVNKIDFLKVRAYLKEPSLNIKVTQLPNYLILSATRIDKLLRIKCSIIPEDDNFLLLITTNKKFVLRNKIYLKVKKNGILL